MNFIKKIGGLLWSGKDNQEYLTESPNLKKRKSDLKDQIQPSKRVKLNSALDSQRPSSSEGLLSKFSSWLTGSRNIPVTKESNFDCTRVVISFEKISIAVSGKDPDKISCGQIMLKDIDLDESENCAVLIKQFQKDVNTIGSRNISHEENNTIHSTNLNDNSALIKGDGGEVRYLQGWSVLLFRKKLYVEGEMIDLTETYPTCNNWLMTQNIVKRMSPSRIATKQGTVYVLEGLMKSPRGTENFGVIPNFIVDKFRHGFPSNWESLLDHWITFNDNYSFEEASSDPVCSPISKRLSSSVIHSEEECGSIRGGSSFKSYPSTSTPDSCSSKDVTSSNHVKVTNFSSICDTEVPHNLVSLDTNLDLEGSENYSCSSGGGYIKTREFAKLNLEEQLYRQNSFSKEQRPLSLPFSLVRAKDYPKTTLVNHRKVYICWFCQYSSRLFKTLKSHMRSKHLHSTNDDLENLTISV